MPLIAGIIDISQPTHRANFLLRLPQARRDYSQRHLRLRQ